MLTLILLGFSTELASVHKVQLNSVAPGGVSVSIVPPANWNISPLPMLLGCVSEGGTHQSTLRTSLIMRGRKEHASITPTLTLWVSGDDGDHLTGVCNLVDDRSGQIVQLQHDLTVVAGTPPLGASLVPTVQVHPPTD